MIMETKMTRQEFLQRLCEKVSARSANTTTISRKEFIEKMRERAEGNPVKALTKEQFLEMMRERVNNQHRQI